MSKRVLLLTSHRSHKKHDIEALEQDGGGDASQHTFYISNAQRRIKLQAKSAVSKLQR